ncbi:MAG: DUF72 domain-containing protein [Cyclobacteriaceae bacterium]|nr:DUF72 domain-containing protein [Cyclobacteriaceae bacterium]
MEFGRVPSEQLDTIDFTLPPDRPETGNVLRQQKNHHNHFQIYVGCAKWGRPDWVGKIYPKGTKAGEFLEHYARKFKCIELNATFYRMPTRRQTSTWKSKVPDDFKFCPKFTDQITHLRRLKDVQQLTDRFLDGISGFGNNLGPVFLMPHPAMGPNSAETIMAFVESLPRDLELFIELRHPQWFADPNSFAKLSSFLQQMNVGMVITDAAGRRDCLHMRLTTPYAFIRFVGNSLHASDYQRCMDWVHRIANWKEAGIRSVYFFMHQHNELHSPELCRFLIPEINKKLGTDIPVPEFVVGTN